MAKRKTIKLHISIAPVRDLQLGVFRDKWMREQKTLLCKPFDREIIRILMTPAQKQKKSSGRRNSIPVDNEAYVFTGYPEGQTEVFLKKTIGSCRFLWNHMKADRDEAYKTSGRTYKPKPSDYKKDPDLLWLNEVDSVALCNVQKNLERAYEEFLSGEKGRPRFKKRRLAKDSYTTNLSNKEYPNLRLEGDLLYLPKCPGPIKLTTHRKIRGGGTLKNCTVTHDPTGKWLFSLVFEYPAEEHDLSDPVRRFLEDGDLDALKHIGLDMSLPSLYIDSNGNKPSYSLKDSIVTFEKHYRKLEGRIAREQRRLSRMEKDSSNYRKQCTKIAKLHAKAKHQRSDFLHQISVRLVREYDVISIENIDLSAMKKALKFGKSVSDNGWGMFVNMLQYKAERYGTLVVKVSRWFPSSKTCSRCGHVHKDLQLSDRMYYCPKCGNLMDRDQQAGINLDREGLRILLETYSQLGQDTAEASA